MKSNNSIASEHQFSKLEIMLYPADIDMNKTILAKNFNYNPELIAYTLLEAVKQLKQNGQSIDLSPNESFRKIIGIKWP